jgi:hypothetical protein
MRRDHGSCDQLARRLIAQSDAIHFTAHVYALMFRIIAAGGHSLNFPQERALTKCQFGAP